MAKMSSRSPWRISRGARRNSRVAESASMTAEVVASLTASGTPSSLARRGEALRGLAHALADHDEGRLETHERLDSRRDDLAGLRPQELGLARPDDLDPARLHVLEIAGERQARLLEARVGDRTREAALARQQLPAQGREPALAEHPLGRQRLAAVHHPTASRRLIAELRASAVRVSGTTAAPPGYAGAGRCSPAPEGGPPAAPAATARRRRGEPARLRRRRTGWAPAASRIPRLCASAPEPCSEGSRSRRRPLSRPAARGRGAGRRGPERCGPHPRAPGAARRRTRTSSRVSTGMSSRMCSGLSR